MNIFFYLILFLLSIYSYSLMDLNFTLINHPFWNDFRSLIIQLGYFNRPLSTMVFIIFSILVFFLGLKIFKKNKIKPLYIGLTISLICFFSYPFLSHDFFNYLFDAKILTFYNQNPYFHKALDFPNDNWTRFMHWTHRNYPYGPIWLTLTLPFSYLGLGKFILNFISFKILFTLLYLGCIYLISKENKNKALLFALNPLVIYEGLITPHNDMATVFFGLLAIYILKKSKKYFGFFNAFFSIGIKYISIFLIPLLLNYFKTAFLICSLLVTYLIYSNGLNPWYFLNFLVFIPFISEKTLKDWNYFSFILTLTYSPFLLNGTWNSDVYYQKNLIVLFGLFIYIIYLFYFKNVKKSI